MKFMFTASSISSIDIKMMIRFFRLRKIPTMLIAKRIAPSIKKWDSVSKMPPWFFLQMQRQAPPRRVLNIHNPLILVTLLGRHFQYAYAVFRLDKHLLSRTDRFGLALATKGQRRCRDNADQQDNRGQFEWINVVGK